MKLAILSRAPQRLLDPAPARRRARPRPPGARCSTRCASRSTSRAPEPDLQYRGRPLSDYDAILPRIGNSITYFGTAVVRQFEQMDVYTPNTANGITNSRDKLRATQILSRHNIGMPATTFVRNRADVHARDRARRRRARRHQAARGHAGHRRHPRARGRRSPRRSSRRCTRTKQNVLIQSFISGEPGPRHPRPRRRRPGRRRDAARAPSGDEFRSNVHRGGTVEPVELTPEYEQAAVRSAQIMGLRVAGVDMLEGNDGPLVMEVNSSPGLEGIETRDQARRGRRDHRLHRQPGRVPRDRRAPAPHASRPATASPSSSCTRDADIVGKTIGDSGLGERDITVLTLHRGASVIPNPRRGVVLEAERPAALLRQARGDALDDPRAPPPAREGAQAAHRPDPHRRLTARWRMPSGAAVT